MLVIEELLIRRHKVLLFLTTARFCFQLELDITMRLKLVLCKHGVLDWLLVRHLYDF